LPAAVEATEEAVVAVAPGRREGSGERGRAGGARGVEGGGGEDDEPLSPFFFAAAPPRARAPGFNADDGAGERAEALAPPSSSSLGAPGSAAVPPPPPPPPSSTLRHLGVVFPRRTPAPPLLPLLITKALETELEPLSADLMTRTRGSSSISWSFCPERESGGEREGERERGRVFFVVEEKREAKVRRRLFRRDSFSRHSAFWHLLAVSVTGIDRASRPFENPRVQTLRPAGGRKAMGKSAIGNGAVLATPRPFSPPRAACFVQGQSALALKPARSLPRHELTEKAGSCRKLDGGGFFLSLIAEEAGKN